MILSYKEEIICGVPPGSILRPLLFIIMYRNDINQLPLKGRIQLDADDAAIFYGNSNQESLYQDITSDLELLSNWFSKNKLSLNLSKTNNIIFKRPLWLILDKNIVINREEVQ